LRPRINRRAGGRPIASLVAVAAITAMGSIGTGGQPPGFSDWWPLRRAHGGAGAGHAASRAWSSPRNVLRSFEIEHLMVG